MPHRIFEIDEILRIIVQHTRDTSETTTVSLACCCKSFEEPALSHLWVSKSLDELAALLPSILTARAPIEEEWKRFRRYASWIRILFVNLEPGYATQDSILLLDLITPSSENGPTKPCPPSRRSSSEGYVACLRRLTKQATAAMFHNLRNLTWWGLPSSLIHLPPFVSPTLTDLRVNITAGWETVHLPGEYAPLEFVINSTISPSTLRTLCLDIRPEANPSPELKQSVANLVLRSGPTLASFEVEFEVPESVVLHLMSLPNLIIWRAVQPTPMKLVSSPLRPVVSFTQIVYLSLRTATPLGWFSFISALVKDKPHPPPTPHTPALTFGNLTNLDVYPPRGQQCLHLCNFLLTNSDISLLADTLPRLEGVYLGIPCLFNTCRTTFRSLHTFSTRCPKLQRLCIHINMTTLVQDIGSFFEGDGQQTEPRETRADPSVGRRTCRLGLQFAHYLPLEPNVGIDELEVVVKGFSAIYATIDDVTVSDSNTGLWAKVSDGIKVLHV